MYAAIEPERLGMEDILRSLGTVLDTHLARRVDILHRRDGLVVRAEAVANLAARLDGTWSRLEMVLTHMDIVQAQVAAAARHRAGHLAGPHERSLGVLGRLIDERGLRRVSLSLHPANDAWLIWHEADDRPGLALTLLTADDLQAQDAAASLARERRTARGMDSHQERSPRMRRPDRRAPWESAGSREFIPVRPGRAILSHAGAVLET